MAAHSRILAWRVPWTEEPGGLQSMGCKESDMTERLTHVCELSRRLSRVMWVQVCPTRDSSSSNPGLGGTRSSLARLRQKEDQWSCEMPRETWAQT